MDFVFFIATQKLVVQSNRSRPKEFSLSLAVSAFERLAPLTVWIAGRPATVTARSSVINLNSSKLYLLIVLFWPALSNFAGASRLKDGDVRG